jgi:hypothetical protein
MANDKVKLTKQQRIVRALWDRLLNYDNFLVPESVEDLKELFKSPSIKLYGRACFLNREALPILHQMVDKLYEIDEIRTNTSYNTVYKKTLLHIQNALQLKADGSSISFTEIYSSLIRHISCERKTYEFIWNVEGVSLSNLHSLDFGNASLFVFNQEYKNYVEAFENKAQEFQKSVKSFLEKNFINKVCIKCKSYGDREFAETKALNDAQTIINIIRFTFCFLYPNYVYHNRIKINLVPDTMVGRDLFFSINLDDESVTLYGRSRKSVKQDYPIDQELINHLKQDLFWDDLLLLLTKNKRTDIEEAILNSIYWIGEAQNEWTPQIAFIKYWTAIEALIYNPPENEKVTDTVLTGTAIRLVHGGYQFTPVEQYWDLRRQIDKLYDKRSKIIHRGVQGRISYQDVTDICKYSTWIILETLFLRSQGYTNFDQIRSETERLQKIHDQTKHE